MVPELTRVAESQEGVALTSSGWFAVGMTDREPRNTDDLPADRHLREDVAPAASGEQAESPDRDFLPGQTNAGQQVAGLASATGYEEKEKPEQRDSNNPI